MCRYLYIQLVMAATFNVAPLGITMLSAVVKIVTKIYLYVIPQWCPIILYLNLGIQLLWDY